MRLSRGIASASIPSVFLPAVGAARPKRRSPKAEATSAQVGPSLRHRHGALWPMHGTAPVALRISIGPVRPLGRIGASPFEEVVGANTC